jgi:hypothetical protein
MTVPALANVTDSNGNLICPGGVYFGCNGNPNGDGSPAFGRSCGGDQYNAGNGEVAGDWGPRDVQLGMKFIF